MTSLDKKKNTITFPGLSSNIDQLSFSEMLQYRTCCWILFNTGNGECVDTLGKKRRNKGLIPVLMFPEKFNVSECDAL